MILAGTQAAIIFCCPSCTSRTFVDRAQTPLGAIRFRNRIQVPCKNWATRERTHLGLAEAVWPKALPRLATKTTSPSVFFARGRMKLGSCGRSLSGEIGPFGGEREKNRFLTLSFQFLGELQYKPFSSFAAKLVLVVGKWL
eukprot:3543664-Rhodomonas_salina.2